MIPLGTDGVRFGQVFSGEAAFFETDQIVDVAGRDA